MVDSTRHHSNPAPELVLRVRPGPVAAVLAVLVAAFAAAHVVSKVVWTARFEEGKRSEFAERIAECLELDGANSIPTWYSASALLVSSVLLALITLARSRQRANDAIHWGFLSLGLLLLSIDEIANLHEIATFWLRGWINRGWYAVWVTVLLSMALLLLLAYARFLVRLKPTTRYLLLLAAATWLSGAIGCEILGDLIIRRQGPAALSYLAISTLEETLEEAANVILIYALLRYLGVTAGRLRAEIVL